MANYMRKIQSVFHCFLHPRILLSFCYLPEMRVICNHPILRIQEETNNYAVILVIVHSAFRPGIASRARCLGDKRFLKELLVMKFLHGGNKKPANIERPVKAPDVIVRLISSRSRPRMKSVSCAKEHSLSGNQLLMHFSEPHINLCCNKCPTKALLNQSK